MELVFATRNMHKLREIRDMFKPVKSVELLSLMNFPSYEPPEETGETFAENARLKALHAATTLGKWVIADDSGLVVPAIGGEPGVRSHRYSGEDPTDSDNIAKLLGRLSGLKDIERSAHYVAAMAVASPQGIEKEVVGYCEGMITDKPRGCGGFGYDAVFIKYEYEGTFAELTESTKNRISHRRKAVDKLVSYLEALSNRLETQSVR